jgi:hypothetical protein
MVTLDFSRLDDHALMDLQDHVQALARPWRELALLARCCDAPVATLAELPLGERDRLFLEARGRLFGWHVDAESRCVACGERLDLSFDIAEMLRGRAESGAEREIPGETAQLRLRAPNSIDLAEAAVASNPEEALFARCVDADAGDLAALLGDVDLRAAIADRLAQLDPYAEMVLAGRCPQCGAVSDTIFDPAGFLLEEIAAYAEGLVADVDQLARAYGWREADILALGPRRRRRYLELTS